ncbi:DUF5011 domain-containing protein [Hyalangium minutum]|uniref:HYR domain-containing protein n=1 Tax=Hyalangium minutum TaxID=394096 RepID=A0A085W476_9BACT|nr:DUF5011 domain-containing protein [Hyalangium minutum]KFE62489.1 hypothetical protein DB31_3923 [Hyalangium minutum]
MLWLCGATTACDPGSEAFREPAPAEQSGMLDEGSGGVVLEPNTIRGQVRFTNQNPAILQLLNTDTNRIGLVTATSTSPTGFTARTELPGQLNLRGFSFEMSVEAGAGGAGGVTYEVLPRFVWNAQYDYRLYTFAQAQGVQVRPRSEQPLPTELDFSECLGAIAFRFGTDATCATAVPVDQVNWNGLQLRRHPSGAYLSYVKGGSSGTASTLTYRLGTSEYTDTRSYLQNMNWSVGCDELVQVCVPDPGVSQRGALTGPWDIVGEPSQTYRQIVLSGGPDNNLRYHLLNFPQDSRAPGSDPSRWWTLPNMVPGSYSSLRGRGYARRGREFSFFETRNASPSSVVAGPAVPLTRQINGETRYPFVMHPAYFHGAIRLADPYVTAHPGAYSSLQALNFEADYDTNQDGIPNNTDFYAVARYSTQLRAEGQSSASAATSFPGAFSPSTGELSSGYEQLLPYIYDEPHPWRQDLLRLGFWTQGYNFVTRPGQYDPARFRYGYLDLKKKQNTPSTPLQPGQRYRVDHEYCFNEVQVEFSTADTPFFNPTAAISGSFRGADWRGLAADYTVTGLASGIPAAVGIPQSEAITYAQTRGSVSFTLPEGIYTLTPGAMLVNSNGSTNQATFQPIQFTLGCGQRMKLVPPLTVLIAPQPTCASGPSQIVTGVVKSRPAEIDRVWYRLNGGPEVTLCENCGIDYPFHIPVQLQACGNTVQVYAFTAGLPEPATGFQQLVWDDPADGPSCGEAACVNRPPVARCINQVVGASSACAGCASVNDGSYDPDGGEVTCVQTPDCPYALGQNRVTLTCTDAHGQSASCQAMVTVQDTTPPEITCAQPPALECSAGGAVASYAPSATDNCGASPSVTCTPTSGSRFAHGTTAVTCTATDAQGNQARCAFPVSVVDTQAPGLACPAAVTAECSSQGAAAVSLPQAVATDSCQLTQQSGGGVASYPLGTTDVTYSARDVGGNTTACTTQVSVVDTQAPTLTLVGEDPLVVGCGRSATAGVVATDVCQGDLTHRVEVVGLNPSVPGTYAVSYRVRDASGNVAQGAPRTVQVVEDSGPLSLSLNGDSELTLECGQDVYVDLGATAADGCGSPLEVHRYNSGQDAYGPGPDTAAEGTYSVQYLAWDSTGLTVGAIRTVHVDDRTPPALMLRGPAHMVHTCGTGWVDPGVEATDACYGNLSATVSRTGDVNGWAEGLYTLRYAVTDSGGNAAAPLTRTVEVVDCPW